MSRRAGTQVTLDLRKDAVIDAHAIISPQAELAPGVTVAPFAIIEADVASVRDLRLEITMCSASSAR